MNRILLLIIITASATTAKWEIKSKGVDADHIYFSSNMGQNWVTETIPVGQLNGRALIFTSQLNLWLLCDGIVLRNPNVNTVLSNRASAEIPSAFNLKQNYPNPFNPSTKINFTLEKTGFVTLKVYNLLGETIAILLNGVMKAGKHEATFYGENFKSGIYFYTLTSGSKQTTKKMLLLR